MKIAFLCVFFVALWGFYIVPPCEPDALVVVEAVDEDKNNIQHLAVRMPWRFKNMEKVWKSWKQMYV